MFTRKHLQRFRRYLVLAIAALVLNVIVPTTAKAQTVVPSDVTSISNAVISPTIPSEQPTVSLTTLPKPEDKPQPPVKNTLTVRASAYSSTVDQCDGDPFTTASGAKVADGGIAMNGIAFGTKIRIPAYYGDKVFTVTDRMNAKWGNKRIDIWMATRAAAKQWGVRTVTIEVLS
jgi:3D (Asp-Asp-Asp) domain-containing protein